MVPKQLRSGVVWVLAALLPTLHGCYEYTPLATSTPPSGQLVEFQISDQGRVGLSERFGPGLAEVQGRVVAEQGNEYIVNVFRVKQIGGESTQWSGETTRLDRSFVGSIKGRRLSKSRTAVIAVAGLAVIAYFASSRATGGGSMTNDEPSGPPGQTNRIPATRFKRDIQLRLEDMWK
jgi:hypothetical protein